MGSLYDKLKSPSVSSRRLKQLRYLLLFHLIITLIYEVIWTYFCTIGYREDIEKYDTDEIWKREFFKATRNFFIFTEILNFLVLCVGGVATYKNHRLLLICFILMFLMEWGFELIGIYASGDFNIFVYKVICQVTKPGLLLLSLIYCWVMQESASQ
uniref:Uncharacterized protein n=1 Tax=Tetranychus urticae TaxID=32264 RepID=T1KKE6_TETUR